MNQSEKEKQALEYIEQGRDDLSAELLFEIVCDHAEDNDFTKAEEWRQVLLDSNPMAINKIIKSGEILEACKAQAINDDHKRFWRTLYREFTTEEANGFYYSLKKVRLKPGKTIIKQGKLNDKLFFINKGRLKIICESGSKQAFIKQVSAGEAAGFSSFFFMSNATTTVITDSEVSLSYLNHKSYLKAKNQISGFDDKFQNLCAKLVKIDTSDVIRQKKIERRKNPRFQIKGDVFIYSLDRDGKINEQPLRGSLEDLSCGGVSFLRKYSSKEQAQELLGRLAVIKIVPKKRSKGVVEKRKGRIVSILDRMFDNYSIKFKFLEPLPREIVHH